MMMEKKFIGHADQAKLIRLALKKHFPGVKFSVRYSRGSAIDVEYYGYPDEDDVRKIARGYEGGGFDGMTDSSYSINFWLLPDGSTKLARVGEHYGSPEYNTPKPSPDAVYVNFGADFVFVHKKGNSCPDTRLSTSRKPSAKMVTSSRQKWEPVDLDG
jgi:hypothetical protein